jgi:hypothetical protein
MVTASQIDNRVFTIRNGIAANLFVVLLAGFLLASSTVSTGVGVLLISVGTVGIVINSAYAHTDSRC